MLLERFKVGRDNQTSTSLAKSLPDEDRQQGKQNVDVIGQHLPQGSCMEKMTANVIVEKTKQIKELAEIIKLQQA